MAPLPTEPLELAILLHKQMVHGSDRARQIEGALPVDFDFDATKSALETAGLLVSDNKQQHKIEFALPSTFFSSLDELISTGERRISPPAKFYLADCDYLHDGGASDAPLPVQHYLDATQFYGLLGDAADHKGGIGSTKTLFFLQKEKLEIVPNYTVADLRELPGIRTFHVDFISTETHKEQKLTIVRTVLLDMFKGRMRVPFAELLSRFNDFMERLSGSYQLYVSEFSFQKVKAEIEKEKLEATVKLNKVFSDIQSQLLAVPAALILVGGQMENSHSWSSKNISIWLGSLVFAALMTLLVRNQRHTLRAVKQEIDQQWQQIKGKHHPVADRFEDSYRQLDSRYVHQERLIKVVSLLVAISLAVSTGMLLWFSVSQNLMQESLVWGVWCAIPLVVWDFLCYLTKYLPAWIKKHDFTHIICSHSQNEGI